MTSALAEVLEKLEPCPWCGGHAVVDISSGSDERNGYNFSVSIVCVPCSAKLTRGSGYDKNGWCNESTASVTARAITAWNTRPALLASQQYAEANPLGGPASMLETAARRIRAGEDFHEVLADYDLHSGAALLRDAGDGIDYKSKLHAMHRRAQKAEAELAHWKLWANVGWGFKFDKVSAVVNDLGRLTDSFRAIEKLRRTRRLSEDAAMHAPGGATRPPQS